MPNITLLTDTEYEILSKIWELDEKISAKELLAIFNKEGKNWKLSTVNVFLSRLADAGYLKVGLGNRYYLYWAAMDRNTFEQKNAQHILDKLYDGSWENFLTALSGGTSLSEDQEEDLRRWLINHKN